MEINKVLADVQFKLLRTDSIEEAYFFIANAAQSIIGDGIVTAIRLNDENRMQFVTCAGLGPMLEKVIGIFGTDPTKKTKSIGEMSEQEFNRYASGSLEPVGGGIFELMSGLAPKAVCDTSQKLMQVKNVYTIGVIQGGSPLGALVILTRNDIACFKTDIETLVNQAAFIIQRKRAENQLRESERKYRDLFENSKDGIAITDMAGKFIECNQEYLKILGYDSTEEIRNKSYEELTPAEYHDLERRMIGEQTLVKGSCDEYDKEYFRKTGERVAVSLRAWVMQPDRMCVIVRDITERKRAESALLESEASFRSLFEQSATGYVLLSPDGHLLKVNTAMADMLGYTVDELQNTNFRKFTHPDDIDVSAESIRSLLAGGQDTCRFEKRYLHRNGTTVWTFINTTLVRDSNNSPLYFITNIIDITDRKNAEEALRASEARFKQLADSTFEAIVIHENGILLDVNSSFCRMFGYSRSEVIGKPVMELIAPEWTEKVLEYIRIGYDKPYENGVVRKDGTIAVLETIGRPIEYQGRLVRVTAMRDISERKRMEVEIQKVQKLESIGVLAGGIAHDFNNLMGGIFGYIELSRNASADEQVIQWLSNAMNTIGQAKGLTAQLLTFANGGAPVREIGHLFPFVQETAKFALSGSNVSCRSDVPPDLWACNFDRNQIGQVISNMVINARQAMPAGGTVEVSARNTVIAESGHPLLPSGNYVEIRIRDSGTGIPKEDMPKIFDPFYTTKTVGHGLGLSTCYSIINRHGGCIDVESEPGDGTVFRVYLPASAESVAPAPSRQAPGRKGAGTVLVMDDAEIMRETTGAMLESLGYSAVCTENGQAAVDIFAADMQADRSICGLIFDLTVPGGMGGKEAVQEIRELDADIPVFVASGYADDPVMKNPAEHGFTASICKPFRKAELSEMLNTYLTMKK